MLLQYIGDCVYYSVYVAQFGEYTVPLIDHLLELKIGHWDMCVYYFTCSYYSLNSVIWLVRYVAGRNSVSVR